MAEFDPRDPGSSSRNDKSLIWILIPIFIIFLLIMGTNLWHIAHQDFTRFATQPTTRDQGTSK